MRLSILAAMLAFWAMVVRARAAPPIVVPDLPRVAPTSASDAFKTFQLHAGLQLQLVASEPLIQSPVGMCFDEDGRLFVVEMRGYPDERGQMLGRVVVLTASHGDGHYDKSTVYADKLPWPTSVLCYDGGVIVTASPDILFFKDTKHDGIADMRKVLFTGFGAGVERLNVQALVNNPTWGPDDRIYGATSFNGGHVSRPGGKGKPLDLHGSDFSFNPRTLEIRAENGGGQHGLSFGPFGRRFVCMNDKPVETFTYNARYAGRNPMFALPPALVQINADGPDVFKISPDEAWRVLRTRLRVSGLVRGPIEGGGRASGYFTGTSGIAIYTGDALPPNFRGNAFSGEVANNLVHREVIAPDGPGVIAHRAPDEQKQEFLASKDTWFRPVQIANGPDGALYVVDMYREVIEHPWSLPDEIKKRLDLHSGSERGRIWRIVPEGFAPRKPPRLSHATTAQLAELLESPNGWDRDAATRLLFQRQDPGAAPLIRQLLRKSKSAIGRFRALYALDGQSILTINDALIALADPNEHVRARGVLLSERFLREGHCPPGLWTRLCELAGDPSIIVRYQLAFTLGGSDRANRAEPLAKIIEKDSANRWIQAAVVSSSQGIEAVLFARVAGAAQGTAKAPAAGQSFLAELARLIGRAGREPDVAHVNQVIGREASGGQVELAFTLTRALREGLARGKHRMVASAAIAPLLARAAAVACDPSAAGPARIAATRLLGTTNFEQSGRVLSTLLAPNQPQEIQLAAAEALDEFDSPRVGPELIARFGSFPPRVRGAVIAALLKRPDRSLALLRAIQLGRMHASDVTLAQASMLRRQRDPAIRALADKLLAARNPQLDQIIAAYQPALALAGNAEHGHQIYLQRCSSCHHLGSDGFAVGPDLTTIRNDGKAKALVNLIDPNREVAPNYVAYLVETRSGESLLGILANETASSVTIRQAFGKDTVILRSDIRRIESQNLSLMPEGLQAGLSRQDMADLLEFVFTVGGR